jgi:ABC-type nitrate/sulfonate/bicarbonate transport system substrate-binding protein
MHPAEVVDIAEEKKLEREAEGLVELHDFIKSHPDAPVKEIAKFMPPVDSRAVSKAIQMIALRDAEAKKIKKN